MIETCVHHIPIPAMLEPQGTACMQIYIQSAHSFNNLHVSESTGVRLSWCPDTWDAVNNNWNMHPPHSDPRNACDTRNTMHANIYICSAHLFNILHVSDSTGVRINQCLDTWNAVYNDWNMCLPHSDPWHACNNRSSIHANVYTVCTFIQQSACVGQNYCLAKPMSESIECSV